MNYVINEWFDEFMIPSAPEADKARLQAFLRKFYTESSKIVIGRETPFTQKFYKYFKQYENDHVFKQRTTKIFHLLFRDDLKTKIVETYEVKHLPPEILATLPSSDLYLIELANTVPDSIIVTEDNRLIDAVICNPVVKIMHLDEYISD